MLHGQRSARRTRLHRARALCPVLECMETRLVLSAVAGTSFVAPVVEPDFERLVPSGSALGDVVLGATVPVSPDSGSATPVGMTPSQIRTAYGINSIAFGSVNGDGTGQTIAIVDAYDNPSLVNSTAANFATSDLGEFDSQFGIAAPPSFMKLNEQGGTTGLPGTDPSGDWETEEALDVEWAHAIAPAASIVLIECASSSSNDMYQGVQTAAGLSGVSAVSMSWGSGEFADEASSDSIFTTPAGHEGVTFVAATGDAAAPGDYPAYSPNVLAVGGTTLNVGSGGAYESETGWSQGGGGPSDQETEPAFQDPVQSSRFRETPDVAFDGDPSSGVAVYDAYSGGSSAPWQRIGGTSLATPSWAALVAIADQGRVLKGGSTLDGPTQTLPYLYALSASDFHDITAGNNGYQAGPGYDEVTGIGTPSANLVVPALASDGLSDELTVISEPASQITAGSPFGLRVAIESSGGSVDTIAQGSISLSIASGPAGAGLSGSTSATIVNGVATFSGLVLTTAGANYTLAASTSGASPATTSEFSVAPAAPYRLAIVSSPATATAGSAFTVRAAIEDQYGNEVTGNTESISLVIASGPSNAVLGGTTSAQAASGIATFSGLLLTQAADGYTLEAVASGLASAYTGTFSVNPGAAYRLAMASSPSNVIAGGTFGLSVFVEDQYGNQVTTSGISISLGLASGPANETAAVSTAAVDEAGVASFSNLNLTTAGSYQIEAVAAGLIATYTSTFAVAPAAAYQLAIGSPPANLAAGDTFGISVLVEDRYGNQVTTSGIEVTLGLAGGPSSEGSAASAIAFEADGLASFNGLMFTTAASNFGLEAAANGLISATTSPFTVSPAAATQVAFAAGPPSLIGAGEPFGVTVEIEDRFNNVVTDAGQPVSLSIASGPAGASLIGGSALSP